MQCFIHRVAWSKNHVLALQGNEEWVKHYEVRAVISQAGMVRLRLCL